MKLIIYFTEKRFVEFNDVFDLSIKCENNCDFDFDFYDELDIDETYQVRHVHHFTLRSGEFVKYEVLLYEKR